MKLFKMLVCAVALTAVSPAAFAIGVMDKDEVRDGQLVCMSQDNKPAKVSSSAGSSSQDHAEPVSSASAK